MVDPRVHALSLDSVTTVKTAPTDRRLRVVFVDHVARLSGGEIAMLRLLPALAEHVDVHVVLGEDGPLVQRLRDAGIATRCCRSRRPSAT